MAKLEALTFGSSHLLRQAKAKTHVTAIISGPAVRTVTRQAHMGSSDGPVIGQLTLEVG